MTQQNLSTELRLAACDLVTTRFAGRAELRRRATGSDVALVRLELRLGLATDAVLAAVILARAESLAARSLDARVQQVLALPRGAAREVLCARYYAQSADDVVERSHLSALAPRLCAEVDAKRAARRSRGLLSRVEQHLIARFTEVLGAARLRTATHSHEQTIAIVAPGGEWAESTSGSISSSAAGMRSAYCRAAYSVATSEHTWRVSAAIVSPEVRSLNSAAPVGIVYLSACCRVRNGRGTSLVTEILSARAAWVVS